MSNLPMPRGNDEQSLRQLVRAVEIQQHTDLAVFEYHQVVRFAAECDRIDSQAVSDAVRTALEEELNLLDWGMQEASGSAAKAELVARKVAIQSRINNARIQRRFGA
jgi:hypothetical protein